MRPWRPMRSARRSSRCVVLARAWLRSDVSADQALYLFLVPPVLVAGIVGGLGPGLLATAYATVLQHLC